MRLSCLFSDGMAMQRNKTNFVRGNTDPGIMVKGTFGAQPEKQVYLTIAGAYDIVCMGKTI